MLYNQLPLWPVLYVRSNVCLCMCASVSTLLCVPGCDCWIATADYRATSIRVQQQLPFREVSRMTPGWHGSD